MQESGVPRGEIFLTTKLWNNSHHPDVSIPLSTRDLELSFLQDVEKACDASLKDLGTDYVDLYLMHWPSPFARSDKLRPTDENGSVIPGDTPYTETWEALEKLQEKGKCRAIGISNFSKAELETLLQHAKITPVLSPFSLQSIFSKA